MFLNKFCLIVLVYIEQTVPEIHLALETVPKQSLAIAS